MNLSLCIYVLILYTQNQFWFNILFLSEVRIIFYETQPQSQNG